ncbi:hypothetical protein Lal_00028362 [Lupinus albus]|nr:hypothetical protein Lal_00028362 [Lupinus albus]
MWDPFKDFQFPNSVSGSFGNENSAFVNARVDWKETEEEHVLKADIPGLKKEEVKVEIEDDRVLQISDQVKAAMENGVLTITVPKEEIKKPHVKAIEISG